MPGASTLWCPDLSKSCTWRHFSEFQRKIFTSVRCRDLRSVKFSSACDFARTWYLYRVEGSENHHIQMGTSTSIRGNFAETSWKTPRNFCSPGLRDLICCTIDLSSIGSQIVTMTSSNSLYRPASSFLYASKKEGVSASVRIDTLDICRPKEWRSCSISACIYNVVDEILCHEKVSPFESNCSWS